MFKPSKAHVSGLQWDGSIDYQHCKHLKVDQWGTYLFNINYEKLHKLLKILHKENTKRIQRQ